MSMGGARAGEADARLPAPEMTSEDTRRRLRKRNLRDYSWIIGAVWVMGAVTAPDWPGVFIATPSLALSMLVLVHVWRGTPSRGLMVSAVCVGLVTLVATSYLQNNVSGSSGIALVAGLWIAGRPSYRKRLVLCTAILIAGVSCLAFLSNEDTALQTVLMQTVFGAAWAWTVVDVEEHNLLVRTLERAKDAEQEASLLRQRTRIAADLHDIQGHTLHVIKLKAAVAARVQSTDPERTTQELAAIQELVAESIDQGRQLVNSGQRLSLANELTNAVHLLEAAGIDVSVGGAESVEEGWEPDAALVLREATTNILRHARATRVEVEVGPRSIEVRNDGVIADPRPQRGLATLGERVRELGGTFSAGLGSEPDARFAVRATGGSPT